MRSEEPAAIAGSGISVSVIQKKKKQHWKPQMESQQYTSQPEEGGHFVSANKTACSIHRAIMNARRRAIFSKHIPQRAKYTPKGARLCFSWVFFKSTHRCNRRRTWSFTVQTHPHGAQHALSSRLDNVAFHLILKYARATEIMSVIGLKERKEKNVKQDKSRKLVSEWQK